MMKNQKQRNQIAEENNFHEFRLGFYTKTEERYLHKNVNFFTLKKSYTNNREIIFGSRVKTYFTFLCKF